MSLTHPSAVEPIEFNEWRPVHMEYVDLIDPANRGLCLAKYNDELYKTHNPVYVPEFDESIVISSADEETRRYFGVLGNLKISKRYDELAAITDYLIDFKVTKTKWGRFERVGYYDYKRIFFDLELDGTPWEGYEDRIRQYTLDNIALLNMCSKKLNIDLMKYVPSYCKIIP